MRICKNKITDDIQELFGANPLKVPESRIQPLCLLEIKDNKPHYLGQFKYMVKGDFNYPLEIKDSAVSRVSNVKTKKINFEFGFKILGNFLKAFKLDPVVVSAAINQSNKMAFSFNDVQRKYIEPLELGKILSDNDVLGDADNVFIKKIIENSDLKLALITDVLMSTNFSLSTYKENETAAKIDIPKIQGYVEEMKLDLKVEKTSESEIEFKGTEALTFAFSCVEIKIDPVTGKFSTGDWLENIRSAKGAEGNNENDNKIHKMKMGSNKANPLLFNL